MSTLSIFLERISSRLFLFLFAKIFASKLVLMNLLFTIVKCKKTKGTKSNDYFSSEFTFVPDLGGGVPEGSEIGKNKK